MIHKWHEVDLSGIKAINSRLALAKFHGWERDIANWTSAKIKELARYEQMMTDIEKDWNLYSDTEQETQEFYSVVSLCYLLLGGKMTGVNIDEEIARLTKIYYKVED